MTYQTIVKDSTLQLKNNHLGYPLVDWCCDEMKKAYDSNFISFGEREWGNTINGFCLYDVHCYPEGPSVYELKIDYCPFCGEKIIEKTS